MTIVHYAKLETRNEDSQLTMSVLIAINSDEMINYTHHKESYGIAHADDCIALRAQEGGFVQ